MQGIGWRRLELGNQVPIEVPRIFGLGMNQQRSTTDFLPSASGPANHIGQQASAETAALVVQGYSQSGQ